MTFRLTVLMVFPSRGGRNVFASAQRHTLVGSVKTASRLQRAAAGRLQIAEQPVADWGLISCGCCVGRPGF